MPPQTLLVEAQRDEQTRQREERERDEDVEVEQEIGEVEMGGLGAVQLGTAEGGDYVVVDDVPESEGFAAVVVGVYEEGRDLRVSRHSLGTDINCCLGIRRIFETRTATLAPTAAAIARVLHLFASNCALAPP